MTEKKTTTKNATAETFDVQTRSIATEERCQYFMNE